MDYKEIQKSNNILKLYEVISGAHPEKYFTFIIDTYDYSDLLYSERTRVYKYFEFKFYNASSSDEISFEFNMYFDKIINLLSSIQKSFESSVEIIVKSGQDYVSPILINYNTIQESLLFFRRIFITEFKYVLSQNLIEKSENMELWNFNLTNEELERGKKDYLSNLKQGNSSFMVGELKFEIYKFEIDFENNAYYEGEFEDEDEDEDEVDIEEEFNSLIESIFEAGKTLPFLESRLRNTAFDYIKTNFYVKTSFHEKYIDILTFLVITDIASGMIFDYIDSIYPSIPHSMQSILDFKSNLESDILKNRYKQYSINSVKPNNDPILPHILKLINGLLPKNPVNEVEPILFKGSLKEFIIEFAPIIRAHKLKINGNNDLNEIIKEILRHFIVKTDKGRVSFILPRLFLEANLLDFKNNIEIFKSNNSINISKLIWGSTSTEFAELFNPILAKEKLIVGEKRRKYVRHTIIVELYKHFEIANTKDSTKNITEVSFVTSFNRIKYDKK